ncbi:MAG: Holliday junction branch migration protein RuvA [Eubacteriales bacterium]
MFYYIKGKTVLCEDSQVVIDANGVAYAMTVSMNTLAAVSSRSFNGDTDATLYTYLSVREDGVELFGFYTLEELHMFKLLITVSGIGPKAAMSLLSFMTPDSIAAAIATEDKKMISKAPGIGPKTAARIILELKDKVQASPVTNNEVNAPTFNDATGTDKYSDALEALTVLGFHRNNADAVLKTINVSALELEDVIREALKKLMK